MIGNNGRKICMICEGDEEAEYPKDLYSDNLHINVSVDVTDFKPISIEKLKERIQKTGKGENI